MKYFLKWLLAIVLGLAILGTAFVLLVEKIIREGSTYTIGSVAISEDRTVAAREFQFNGGATTPFISDVFISSLKTDPKEGQPALTVTRPNSLSNPNGVAFQWLSPTHLEIECLYEATTVKRMGVLITKGFTMDIEGKPIQVSLVSVRKWKPPAK